MLARLRMSAFAVAIGGKADMGWCIFDPKRTWLIAAQMSDFDPKRTSFPDTGLSRYDACSEPRGRQ
jgi:hypothetical protein